MTGFDVEAALNGLAALVTTIPSLGYVRPRTPRHNLADGLSGDPMLSGQLALRDTALSVSQPDLSDQVVGEHRHPLPGSACDRLRVSTTSMPTTNAVAANSGSVRLAARDSVPLDSVSDVLRLRSSVQVRRTNAADGPAVAVVEDAGRFRRRFVASRQDVGDDVCASLPPIDTSGAVPVAVLAASPEPTCPDLGPEYRPLSIDFRPEPIFRCAGQAAFTAAELPPALADTARCFGEVTVTSDADQMNARRILTGHRVSPNLGVAPPDVSASRGLQCGLSEQESNLHGSASATHQSRQRDRVCLSATAQLFNYTAYQIGDAA